MMSRIKAKKITILAGRPTRPGCAHDQLWPVVFAAGPFDGVHLVYLLTYPLCTLYTVLTVVPEHSFIDALLPSFLLPLTITLRMGLTNGRVVADVSEAQIARSWTNRCSACKMGAVSPSILFLQIEQGVHTPHQGCSWGRVILLSILAIFCAWAVERQFWQWDEIHGNSNSSMYLIALSKSLLCRPCTKNC